jgi:uncharacterized protein (DUF697 family)
VPKWNDLNTAFNTLREIDATAIREESEAPLTIACIGSRTIVEEIGALLNHPSDRRYGPAGEDPLVFYVDPTRTAAASLPNADLLILAVEHLQSSSLKKPALLQQIGQLGLPTILVIRADSTRPIPQTVDTYLPDAAIVHLGDFDGDQRREQLATEILARLPSQFHLSAARRLPGLRDTLSRQLLQAVSFTNASYALASALPEQVPILNLPFAAADIVILTKNQAMLVYKLALLHGAPPDFQERMVEVLPVIGGAYVWRQLARTLVGLIPFWGVVPKVAIAYAGTYTTGHLALAWFAEGHQLTAENMRQLSQEALAIGRERAEILLQAARERSDEALMPAQRWYQKLKTRLPFQRRAEGSIEHDQ